MKQKRWKNYTAMGKFNRKTFIITKKTKDIIKTKSIGEVGDDDIKSDVAYVKEKE